MKIAFVSLGCDKNLADTELMLEILRGKGYEFTDDAQEADADRKSGSAGMPRP